MTKAQVSQRIRECGIIPGLRLSSPQDALFAAEAVVRAGIPIVEVTMTTPGAIEVIAELARHHSGVIAGAGTVCDLETARHCLDVGARFLTSTGLDLEIVNFAVKQNVVVFPGALTPSEVMAAWKARPDFVKIFPCSLLGGPAYIRALKAPFPHVPLIAAGGVNQQTAAEFLRAGAVALGIGSELVPHEAVKLRQDHWIGELARRFIGVIKETREQVAV